MTRKSLIIFSAVIILLSFASLYLFLRERRAAKEDVDFEGRTYRNEVYGYRMYFPLGWEIEEKEERKFSFFHSALENEKFSENREFWNTYKQDFGINLVGVSPLTHIDGEINYNIEKHIYLNENNFTLRQWYNLAALAEAFSSAKISEGDFIRTRNSIMEEDVEADDIEEVFDPWMPRGEVIQVGNKDVLKTTFPRAHRYQGYQYYIFPFKDYFFVFHFGYGGPVIPRDMWQRSDRHIKDMIKSLQPLQEE